MSRKVLAALKKPLRLSRLICLTVRDQRIYLDLPKTCGNVMMDDCAGTGIPALYPASIADEPRRIPTHSKPGYPG
jgi:hypothetical protein